MEQNCPGKPQEVRGRQDQGQGAEAVEGKTSPAGVAQISRGDHQQKKAREDHRPGVL